MVRTIVFLLSLQIGTYDKYMQKKISKAPLSPIIKWAGGKEKEIPQIIDNMPTDFINYYEPFVGGGSVYTAIQAQHSFINDKCNELISLLAYIKSQDATFFFWLQLINGTWCEMLSFARQQKQLMDVYKAYREGQISDIELKTFINNYVSLQQEELLSILPNEFFWLRNIYIEEVKQNITRKMLRMKKIEQQKRLLPDGDICENIDTAFMSALYMYFRSLYNDDDLKKNHSKLLVALFCFIRNYSYSGMFRYNSNGDFNVPYGGIAYNNKTLANKISYYKSAELQALFDRTHIYNQDFETFFNEVTPTAEDFIFLDPPYDSDFSTYAGNEFTREDQKRLAKYLCEQCKAKWMMVIKYTPFIYSLYADRGLNIQAFEKQYLVSFMNRNDKKTKHLIITNY